MGHPRPPAAPRGVYCPIITPLDVDEGLDEPALRRQIDRLVGSVDGILVLGTSGELPILPGATAQATLNVTAEHVAGRVPLVCGVGDVGTKRSVAHVRRAVESGADFVAVTTPYYYPVDEAGMYRHFMTVAEASAVPVALYNIPRNTHTVMTRNMVTRLAEHPNIVAVKDSGGDRELFSWLLETRESTNLTILQGTDESNARGYWEQGIDGYVSGLENLAPGTMRALAQAVRNGDLTAAEDLQACLDALVDLTGRHFWLSVLKAGVAEQGIGTGAISAPLSTVPEDDRRLLRKTLEDLALMP